MKKIGVIFGLNFIILVLSAFSFMAVAEAPPSLLSHQFYGEVTWGEDEITPTEVLVKIGDKEYTSAIESSPCAEAVCTGKYGYDAENLLRVQGKANDKVLFFINNVKVKEYAYKDNVVTQLDLSLAAEEAAETPQEPAEKVLEEPAELPPEEPVAKTPEEAAELPPEEYVAETPQGHAAEVPQEPEPAAEPKSFVYVPSAGLASEESAEEVPEEEKSFLSSNLYFILGGVLVLIAVAVLIIFFFRKNQGGAVQAESPQDYQQ